MSNPVGSPTALIGIQLRAPAAPRTAPPHTGFSAAARLSRPWLSPLIPHAPRGHSMVTQAGAGLPCELQLIALLARPEGFEPPTTWFEARYSIQLSYGRVTRAVYQASSGPPAGITPCRRRRPAPAGWRAPGPHSSSPYAHSRPEVPSGRGCRRPREPPGPAYLPAAGGAELRPQPPASDPVPRGPPAIDVPAQGQWSSPCPARKIGAPPIRGIPK